MKTVLHTLVILAAALLVAGATWAAVQAVGVQLLGVRRDGPAELGGGFPGGRPGFAQDFQPGQRPRRVPGEAGFPGGFGGRGGREAGSLFGLTTVFKNLFIVGVITCAVIAVTLLGQSVRRAWRSAEAANRRT